MNKFDRRGFLAGTTGVAGLVMLGGLSAPARAQGGPLNVGVLIPGSKSDKGWMESGYDGMKAAEKKLGNKASVKFIENVKFGDMEQVLVTLAGKNEMVMTSREKKLGPPTSFTASITTRVELPRRPCASHCSSFL